MLRDRQDERQTGVHVEGQTDGLTDRQTDGRTDLYFLCRRPTALGRFLILFLVT